MSLFKMFCIWRNPLQLKKKTSMALPLPIQLTPPPLLKLYMSERTKPRPLFHLGVEFILEAKNNKNLKWK